MATWTVSRNPTKIPAGHDDLESRDASKTTCMGNQIEHTNGVLAVAYGELQSDLAKLQVFVSLIWSGSFVLLG